MMYIKPIACKGRPVEILPITAMSVLTEVIQKLINLIWKPKQYVDLTADRESGSAKRLEYDIIIIGGGMLPFFLSVIKSQKRFG
jgi:hypothetical protein